LQKTTIAEMTQHKPLTQPENEHYDIHEGQKSGHERIHVRGGRDSQGYGMPIVPGGPHLYIFNFTSNSFPGGMAAFPAHLELNTKRLKRNHILLSWVVNLWKLHAVL
jgi:hypothetical protein